MVSYNRKRKRKKDRRQRSRRKCSHRNEATATIGELTADAIKHLEEGLADGSIPFFGTFGDVPDFPDDLRKDPRYIGHLD